jgi:hypothetical protein
MNDLLETKDTGWKRVTRPLVLLLRRGDFSASAPKPDSQVDLLADSMRDLLASSRDVERASAGMERDFLSLGQVMQRLAETGQDLTKEAAHLVNLAVGEIEGENVIQSASALVRKVVKVSTQANEQTMELVRRMRSYEKKLQNLVHREKQVLECTSTLTFIRMLFKINSATLSEQTKVIFGSLATDMEKLDRQVRETFVNQFAILRGTEKTIDQTATLLEREILDHQEILLQRRKVVHGSLNILQGQLEVNRVKNLKLADLSGGLTKTVSDVVVGLQFHDITHQRLQHIANNIAEMNDRHQEALTSDKVIPENNLLHYLHHGALLQFRQAQGAVTDL